MVYKWIKLKEVDLLIFALKNGEHNARQVAAQGLGKLKIKEALPNLINTVDSYFYEISIAAIKAVENIGGISKETEIKLIKKKEYWRKRSLANKSQRTCKINRWERTSKKTYENVKEMLKRPMHDGKWF